jgi:hypothetical protein
MGFIKRSSVVICVFCKFAFAWFCGDMHCVVLYALRCSRLLATWQSVFSCVHLCGAQAKVRLTGGGGGWHTLPPLCGGV